MAGVAMSLPKHPSCANPRSSSTMTTTLGAPGGGAGRGGNAGVDSAIVRPMTARFPAPVRATTCAPLPVDGRMTVASDCPPRSRRCSPRRRGGLRREPTPAVAGGDRLGSPPPALRRIGRRPPTTHRPARASGGCAAPAAVLPGLISRNEARSSDAVPQVTYLVAPMPRSFRFEPPEPRPGTLTRPRLLRTLLGRWEHRITVIVGGPGLGKTTVLGQALAENRMAPRGEDVWIGVEPADADGETLARDAAWAVDARAVAPPPEESATAGGRPTGGAPRPGTDPQAVSDAVWRRAPTPVCLVFDDIHLVPPGSPGATWLSDLADALPANGHLVFAGRAAPAIPLAGSSTPGSVVEVTEDDLRFTADELAGFAGARGVEAEELADTAGWPAMAELAASVDRDRAAEYLWEEVLEPLGSERRRILAVVTDLDGADDALARAVLA